MSKPEVILGAWLKVFMAITDETHKDRAKICAQCPKARYNRYVSMVNDELIDIKGMVCDECGCPLSAKIRSTDNCPLENW